MLDDHPWLFNTEGIIVEEQQWYNLIDSCGDKRVHTIPKGISPKVNALAWLEFELAYLTAIIWHFNHYATGHRLTDYQYNIYTKFLNHKLDATQGSSFKAVFSVFDFQVFFLYRFLYEG